MHDRPLETGLAALAAIWRPPGYYLLLAEAVHRFGQSRFGQDWNGREVFVLSPVPRLPSGAHQERAHEASNRLDAVVGEMRTLLVCGTIVAAIHNLDTGDVGPPLKPKFWISELSLSFFRLPGMLNANRVVLEKATKNELPPQQETMGRSTRGRIVVKGKSLDQFLSGGSTSRTAATARYSEAALRDWYEKRVAAWLASNPRPPPPSRDDDLAAARAALGANIPREPVRALRNNLAPESWHKSKKKT